MKFLLLNGHGISIRVDSAKLHIKDGAYSVEVEPKEYIYSPRRIDINNIIIYGDNGNITIDAMRWLMKHSVQITLLNWNGQLLTTMCPESDNVEVKIRQYEAYLNNDFRVKVAKEIIKSKFDKTKDFLEYLKQRYDNVETDISKYYKELNNCKSTKEILLIEAKVANYHWNQIYKIIPKEYEFESRCYPNKPRSAGDQVNCMFNYGYSILESEIKRAINSSGLDSHIGFLHEQQTGKVSLAYDLQEPFRFLIDLSVINLIEKNVMKRSDFIRTENYNLRLRPTGANKLLEEINKQFNKTVKYKGYMYSWSYIMLDKARELVQYLNKKKSKLDFSDPKFVLDRDDKIDILEKIKNTSYPEWKKKGYAKSTLHNLKQKVKANKTFTLNKHVLKRFSD